MGGTREISIISYRPVTSSDLNKKGGSVATFLQLVVAEVSGDEAKMKGKMRDLCWQGTSTQH